jgi:hypothetical protein
MTINPFEGDSQDQAYGRSRLSHFFYSLFRQCHGADRRTWVKAPGTYHISAGSHTFVVGLREDGAQLDKIYLTTGSDTPSGTGGAAAN